MHFYLYDKSVTERKYEGTLTKIENRLIELGINGHTEKMSVLKSTPALIRDSIDRGANTVVVVGNDETFLDVVEVIGNFPKAVLGFIPLEEHTKVGPLLGIPPYEAACDVLSMRIIEHMDLGVINDEHYFLGSLEMPAQAELEFEGPYTVKTKSNTNHLAITNLGRMFSGDEELVRNATDGHMEAIVVKQEKRGLFRRGEVATSESVIPFTNTRVLSASTDEVKAVADSRKSYSTPMNIRVAPKKLRVIVGKSRQIARS